MHNKSSKRFCIVNHTDKLQNSFAAFFLFYLIFLSFRIMFSKITAQFRIVNAVLHSIQQCLGGFGGV